MVLDSSIRTLSIRTLSILVFDTVGEMASTTLSMIRLSKMGAMATLITTALNS
jgi:hypothetical protein